MVQMFMGRMHAKSRTHRFLSSSNLAAPRVWRHELRGAARRVWGHELRSAVYARMSVRKWLCAWIIGSCILGFLYSSILETPDDLLRCMGHILRRDHQFLRSSILTFFDS